MGREARVPANYISRIERGTVEPGLSIQERLAAALGVRLDELMADAVRERQRYRDRELER